ncbi:MAG: dihydrofolate reductase family protein [Opitutales bacterium]|nr:dihydrofolate reductase family protein [Opitutales bacterium]MCH8540170.1 dihydrofolate reductase family protein [Opitutales bacterium]
MSKSNQTIQTLLLAAVSLDGKISTGDHQSFSSPEDKRHFFASVETCDGCVFGSGSFEEDPSWMLHELMPGKPRVVVTRKAEAYRQRYPEGETLKFLGDDPGPILDWLSAQGCRKVALLGGGHVYSVFFRHQLVDRALITLEPLVLGEGTPFCREACETHLCLRKVENLNPNTLLLDFAPKEN